AIAGSVRAGSRTAVINLDTLGTGVLDRDRHAESCISDHRLLWQLRSEVEAGDQCRGAFHLCTHQGFALRINFAGCVPVASVISFDNSFARAREIVQEFRRGSEIWKTQFLSDCR